MTQLFWILVPLAVSLIGIYTIGRWWADRQEGPYQFSCPEKREAFERWHDHQIEQFRTAMNALFALAAAALGYSLTLLSDSNQSLVNNNTTCIRIFTCAFAVSFVLGFLSIFNRLEDFRRTKMRHKLRDQKPDDPEIKALYKTTHRIGVWSWGLFYCQVLSFALSGGTIIWFWIANYVGKL